VTDNSGISLQFASLLYARNNYFGDIRIAASINPSKNLVIPTSFHMDEQKSRSDLIGVEREVSTQLLESDWSFIASGMMNEIFNHFGYWKCPLFDDKGNYIREIFAK